MFWPLTKKYIESMDVVFMENIIFWKKISLGELSNLEGNV